MLLEDVVIELDVLHVHAMHDAVRRARDGTHDLVDQLRVVVDHFLEIVAREAQHLAVSKCPESHGMLMPVDEAELAREIALPQ